jgi:DNA polymerase I
VSSLSSPPRTAVSPGVAGSWLVQSLDDTGRPTAAPVDLPDDAALAATVTGLEGAPGSPTSTRWVWRGTTGVYPRLLAAGVRVARCHDLDHTEALLLGHEGRWAHLARRPATVVWDDDRGEQPSLLDELGRHDDAVAAADRLPRLLAEHAEQVQRLTAARVANPRLPLLVAAECAAALTAGELGHVGLPWDGDAHDAILTELLGTRTTPPVRPEHLQHLADQVAAALESPGLNVDSPTDVLRALRRAGLPVASTGRGQLSRYDHPVVPLLRRYKELSRLWTAHGWAWRAAWVRQGRFHPEYLPAGVVSGRWATRGGGALQIPKAVRGAVLAPPGRRLVVADAGQLEPRVLAALSRDPGMVAATEAGDLYTAIATTALGRADARAEAKLALLSAMYGGGAGSPALAALKRRFPAATALLEQAATTGEDGGSVRSILGRVSPPAGPSWLVGLDDATAGSHARSRGRFTRNFVVQASAADWAAVLVAGLRTRLARLPVNDGWQPQLVFFQHDEVMVECAADQVDDVVVAVAEAGAEATSLVLGDSGVRIPLTAAALDSYADKQ